MKLPEMPYQSALTKSYQSKFGGYNHTLSAGDGEIYNIMNMTSDDIPVLSSRSPRNSTSAVSANNGIIAIESVIYRVHNNSLYQGDTYLGSVSNTKKTFATMPYYLVVYPDKKVVRLDVKGYYSDLSALNAAVSSPKVNDIYGIGSSGNYVTYYWSGTEWKNSGNVVETMASTWSGAAIILYSDVLGGFQAWKNTIRSNVAGTDFSTLFRVGDAVNISGDTIAGNNKSAVIEEIDGNKLRFAENVFEVDLIKPTYIETSPAGTNPHDTTVVSDVMTLSEGVYYLVWPETPNYSVFSVGTENSAIRNKTGYIKSYYGSVKFQQSGSSTWVDVTTTVKTNNEIKTWEAENSNYANHAVANLKIERYVPELDFIIGHHNRLWGCKGDKIYASKLGDPINFNVFEGLSTDSYVVETGTPGEFTGVYSYLGYPLFFKENSIIKIYGDKPAEYQTYDTATRGVAAGSERSLAVAGETLYYHNKSGIMAYTGGVPALVSSVFGGITYKNGKAGSDGNKYYVYLQDKNNYHHLFVYDPSKNVWMKENIAAVTGFINKDGLLWVHTGVLTALTGTPTGTTAEGDVNWEVEFADFYADSPNKKGVSKLHIRLNLASTASAKAYIRHEGEATYSQASTEMKGTYKKSHYLPIIPRRDDNFSVKITGTGKCEIYSLSIEYYAGSQL